MTETWPVSKSDHVCTCWGASVKLWIVSEVEPKWCHATCCTARSNLLYFVALQESTAISFSACRCSSAILALFSRNNLLKRCCTFSNRALSIFVSWCLLWRRRVSQTWSPVLVVRSNFRKKSIRSFATEPSHSRPFDEYQLQCSWYSSNGLVRTVLFCMHVK